MAFTSAITGRTKWGNKMVHWGTYTNSVGSGTGGDIDTGMRSCDFLVIIPTYTAVSANSPVVNETFPLVGTSGATAKVTIVTDAVMNGYWMCFGV
jgi:hypothetical protein